jgi:hypothetical protein
MHIKEVIRQQFCQLHRLTRPNSALSAACHALRHRTEPETGCLFVFAICHGKSDGRMHACMHCGGRRLGGAAEEGPLVRCPAVAARLLRANSRQLVRALTRLGRGCRAPTSAVCSRSKAQKIVPECTRCHAVWAAMSGAAAMSYAAARPCASAAVRARRARRLSASSSSTLSSLRGSPHTLKPSQQSVRSSTHAEYAEYHGAVGNHIESFRKAYVKP